MHAEKQKEMLERLRIHLANGTTDLSPYSLEVPASHYVSEEQAALEVKVMFRQRPLLVALTPQIPNQGDYLTHEVVNTSLLIVRDKYGLARTYITAASSTAAATSRVPS